MAHPASNLATASSLMDTQSNAAPIALVATWVLPRPPRSLDAFKSATLLLAVLAFHTLAVPMPVHAILRVVLVLLRPARTWTVL